MPAMNAVNALAPRPTAALIATDGSTDAALSRTGRTT